MGIDAINHNNTGYDSNNSKVSSYRTSKATEAETKQSNANTGTGPAAVYEKSNVSTSKKVNAETIAKLKQDAETRTQQLRGIVEKMMLNQGRTFTNATDIYAFLRSGDYEVDAATKAQAQADIAEDGYWGVEQTSDRLVSFAQALAGGDASKADEMIAAVKKGFEEATKEWGDTLPDICQKTLDATIEKLNKWKETL